MPDEPKLGPVARRLAATERVLCIEDEPDIAAFLRAYFRAAGYDVVHLDPTSSEQVLDALAEHQPDLVLLDVRLRGFSGLEAYRRMRSEDRYAFTPVIMVSANADPASVAPGGLDGFVPKPFNTDRLAALVRERIDAAAELATRGRHERHEVFGQDYLQARLADEIAIAGRDGHLSLAIVQLRSTHDVLAEVGAGGLGFVLRSLVEQLQAQLPAEAVVGITSRDELAVVLPGTGPRDAYTAVRGALHEVTGELRFAGGAVVPVAVTGGVAAYPESAGDPDGLFMAADAALAEAVDEGSLLQLAR